MFDSGLPDDPTHESYGVSFSTVLDRAIDNVMLAGLELEEGGHFEKALDKDKDEELRSEFALTKQQIGKVRGDVYEDLLSALLWNIAIDSSDSLTSFLNLSLDEEILPKVASVNVGIISLGDNYSLPRLMDELSLANINKFLERLNKDQTHLTFSTPDLICINLSNVSSEIGIYFKKRIHNLVKSSGRKILRESVKKVEEFKLNATSLVYAAGVKTSIKSDRVLQLLYEANAVKYIWYSAFGDSSIKYYAIGLSREGVDINRFNSVSFATPYDPSSGYSRAIDGSGLVGSLDDLRRWFLVSLGVITEEQAKYSNTAVRKPKASPKIQKLVKAPLFDD